MSAHLRPITGKSTHTPGPWVQNEDEQHYLPHEPITIGPCDEGKHRPVCEIVEFDFEGAEANANARLIQSAPDLLSALRRFVACEGGKWHVERYHNERTEALEHARALIAKVEGA